MNWPIRGKADLVEANQRSPRDLFEGKEHYEIPAFQRPYVWNEEDQWAPLWDDIVLVADSYVRAREADAEPKIAQHFLGAVVYQTKPVVTSDVTRHEVIDGQQRMTTLQLVLDAAQQVFDERGHEILAEALEDLTVNKSKVFAGKKERFKLWPSQTDREAFSAAMSGDLDGLIDHRIVQAHSFFRREVGRWLGGKPDEDGLVPPGGEELRAEALSSTLQDRLTLVAIDLSGHDDAQLIFETLNDRGTPLLKADLIKNWVFRQGERLGADVEDWSSCYWADFDSGWWRQEIPQGRQMRSRVDIFLQYWLTMRTHDEVRADQAFRIFVDYAESQMQTINQADNLLSALRRDAEVYRNFAQLDASTPAGRFYALVIETMELAVVTPVFLWLLSENNCVPESQLKLGLECLESWVIRRALLRLTTKDINKFMVHVLKTLDPVVAAKAGEEIAACLAEQTAETRLWPTDSQILAQLPGARVYASIRQSRLRVIFAEVEQHLRKGSNMYEQIQALPSGLEIEHVMPRGWRTHWNANPQLGADLAAQRDKAVNTIGNLTLVTKSLNGSLSNRPWTDAAAAGMTEGGMPSLGKRSLLKDFSLLVLNRQIVKDHLDAWTEQDIAERSGEIAQSICAIWPRLASVADEA